jgi:8-oxo-dGTP pyrophosphatase MutT (NUDIX family)
MEPLIANKRIVAALVPYRRSEKGFEFFLQRRDGNAPTDPNIFSLFGGGVGESEDLPQALLREILEELVYKPERSKYFAVFQRANTTFHVFIEAVGEDFESLVDVREGEYGKFLTIPEIQYSPEVSFIAQLVINDLSSYLGSR